MSWRRHGPRPLPASMHMDTRRSISMSTRARMAEIPALCPPAHQATQPGASGPESCTAAALLGPRAPRQAQREWHPTLRPPPGARCACANRASILFQGDEGAHTGGPCEGWYSPLCGAPPPCKLPPSVKERGETTRASIQPSLSVSVRSLSADVLCPASPCSSSVVGCEHAQRRAGPRRGARGTRRAAARATSRR